MADRMNSIKVEMDKHDKKVEAGAEVMAKAQPEYCSTCVACNKEYSVGLCGYLFKTSYEVWKACTERIIMNEPKVKYTYVRLYQVEIFCPYCRVYIKKLMDTEPHDGMEVECGCCNGKVILMGYI